MNCTFRIQNGARNGSISQCVFLFVLINVYNVHTRFRVQDLLESFTSKGLSGNKLDLVGAFGRLFSVTEMLHEKNTKKRKNLQYYNFRQNRFFMI